MAFTVPTPPYGFDALEPVIDAKTMEIHHDKHHAAYVTKLNEAITKHPELEGKPVEELLKNLSAVPEDIRGVVRNHGGGHYNHSLFWPSLAPVGKGGELSGELGTALEMAFGSVDAFKEKLTNAALGQFGSGWGWLVWTPKKELAVYALPNQDSPLSQDDIPLLGVDVWEHAYYLKYQNKRDEYLKDWWSVVDWNEVGRRYWAAISS